MENQVPEPNCILKVSVCTCEECCLKLRKLFLKVDGVKSVSIDRERELVLIRGNADPIKLVRAISANGEEAEIVYYCKLEFRDNENHIPENRDKKIPQTKHNTKSSAGFNRREPKCHQHDSNDEYDGAECSNHMRESYSSAAAFKREGYSGHTRVNYAAAPPGKVEVVHANKECSVPDCPFHDCYLKSSAPMEMPTTMKFGYMQSDMSPYYSFQQLPAPWGYGYGHGMM